MGDNYIIERKIEPINILIVFLIGLAATLFLVGSIETFEVVGQLQIILIVSTSVLYLVALVAFLWPKEKKTMIASDKVIERIKTVEKPVYRTIEKPIYRTIHKTVHKPAHKPVDKIVHKEIVKTVHKPVGTIAVVHVEKKKKKESKYVGSDYNERYHLRTCRFAGAIKIQYLIEEDDRKYFELRGYVPCKVCKPNKK